MEYNELQELKKRIFIAENAVILLAEAIYKYIGRDIDENMLREEVEKCLSEDVNTHMYHKFVLKDTYENSSISQFIFDLNTDFSEKELNDVEEILLKKEI